jgi:hypothetical protein
MTVIRRPSPLREMVVLRSSLDRLFDESLFPRAFSTAPGDVGMPFDIRISPVSDEHAHDASGQPAGPEPVGA